METVDQVDGDYQSEEGWETAMVELTPSTVPALVHADGGTLLTDGCGAGREPLAQAFLEAGYDAYIAMTAPAANGESALLFTIGFFYFALGEDRGPDPVPCSDAEAVERAAALDSRYRWGTGSFKAWR